MFARVVTPVRVAIRPPIRRVMCHVSPQIIDNTALMYELFAGAGMIVGIGLLTVDIAQKNIAKNAERQIADRTVLKNQRMVSFFDGCRYRQHY